MRPALKLLLAAAGCVCAALPLAGCGLFAGNGSSDVNAAINTLNERYGVEFRLKKKKTAGGAVCSIYATCAETGDKDIFIYQADEKKQPQTDYIYVRYGTEALAAIRASAEKAFPGCRVIVNESVYNHLAGDKYDRNTDLAGYLAENFFHIDVYVPQLPDTKEELISEYTRLEDTLGADGIGWDELALGCPEDFGGIVPADHILCSNEEQYEGLSDSPDYTYSEHCPTEISRDDAVDTGWYIMIGGEVVRQ